MEPFRGKVAIVTGGGSGIGAQLCRQLGEDGATVVVADINEEGAAQVADGIEGASAHFLDVTDRQAFATLIEKTAAEQGQLDYLFNNAGIMTFGEARDIDWDVWDQTLAVNLMGAINGAAPAYRQMVRQGSGHIVNVSSMAGVLATPAAIPYSVAKHGVIGLSSGLRREGEALGVRVTAVCPGFVKTPIQETFGCVKADKEKFATAVKAKFRKMMTAEEAATQILRATTANREIVVFPFLFRFCWWLHRIDPRLAAPIQRMALADFRAARR